MLIYLMEFIFKNKSNYNSLIKGLDLFIKNNKLHLYLKFLYTSNLVLIFFATIISISLLSPLFFLYELSKKKFFISISFFRIKVLYIIISYYRLNKILEYKFIKFTYKSTSF